MATDCECLQTWSASLKHQDGKLHTVAIILVSVRCPTTVFPGVTEAQQKHKHVICRCCVSLIYNYSNVKRITLAISFISIYASTDH